jgi:hypothetical protein
MNRRILAILLAVTVFATAGCARTLQNNQAELGARAKKLRNIVMLPPETKICELSAGGVKRGNGVRGNGVRLV